ncbi:MAG TPA: EAL domain-containing protein [Steroidobacteraceae bacterium]|nr:EAL domain-containing protein [Steroidobacteraceae bacterium]
MQPGSRDRQEVVSSEAKKLPRSLHSGTRILLVEDAEIDAELVMRQVREAGVAAQWRCVADESQLRSELAHFRPDVVLSDFTLPGFDGLSALRIVREVSPDVPFIFVSGTIGEECAIDALQRGALDYVLKHNLARLVPAITRALDDAETRAERKRQELQIARLTRVLRMLSGINGAVIRIRDRAALFNEACRLAVMVGGYPIAVALLKQSDGPGLDVVASNGLERATVERLRAAVSTSIPNETSIVGQVIVKGRFVVCDETTKLDVGDALNFVLQRISSRRAVTLPLLLDSTVWGVLILVAPDSRALIEEELAMLHEVAANLSFALQFLQKDNEVRFLAYFDPNTGLAKRRLFCDRLGRLISGSRGAARCAVAVFDIEKLSVINDSFGRHIGDRLLQLVSERLRSGFHHTEFVAHLGGGTFAVALGSASGSSDPLATLQERLGAIFGRPFDIELRSIPAIIKTGVAVGPEDGTSADVLVQNAEAALGDARAGGHRLVQFSNVQRSAVVGRLALEHKLRLAIERKEFELHYQPEFNARTRRIDSVEGLIRWRSPDEGVVSPAAFLSVLESTGLIATVGEWVIRQAAEDVQNWRRLGLPKVRIAVNVSPRELRYPQFAKRFLQLNHECGAGSLDIEITEGALLDDSDVAVRELKALRESGVRIAIDDFGTGYSSLSRLSDLPIDTLKIDKTFTTRLFTDSLGPTLVSTIITLAHAIGMTVVAEGVETEQQLKILCDLGCDHLQGYFLSQPLPSKQLIELLAENDRQFPFQS